MSKLLHTFLLCIFLTGILAPSFGSNAFELDDTHYEQTECDVNETQEDHANHEMPHQHCHHCYHYHVIVASTNDVDSFDNLSQLFPQYNNSILFNLLYDIKRPPRIIA